MWLSLEQTTWDMNGFMILCAMGSLHKYPEVLHFILGEMNHHKPRSSPTVCNLLLPNSWLREGIFRKDDLTSFELMLPFDKLNTLACPYISLQPYSTPPQLQTLQRAMRFFGLFVFSLSEGGMG